MIEAHDLKARDILGVDTHAQQFLRRDEILGARVRVDVLGGDDTFDDDVLALAASHEDATDLQRRAALGLRADALQAVGRDGKGRHAPKEALRPIRLGFAAIGFIAPTAARRPMARVALVKLGGSVLTDKSQYRTPRLDIIARLAYELSTCADRLMIVHGAGSYGHVLAKEHHMSEGAASPHAVAQVHADVRELQGLLLSALVDRGVPAISLSTYDLARLSAGHLSSFAYEPVHETMTRGFTPVMSGDVVLDAARGTGILSGDVLMVELARAVKPVRAVFVTDVDGIHDKDPMESGAKLLSRIDLTQDVRASESRMPDITGGMAGKLARARDVAKVGVPVHVINGLAHGRLSDVLAGKDVVGTLVTA